MSNFEFKRLRRTIIIFRVVQALLLGLLVFMALNFQQIFYMGGKPELFFSSITAALVIQLILFYPVYRLAKRDAGVEFESSAIGLTAEDLKAFRKKRLLGDLWKFAGITFYVSFVVFVPDAKIAPGVSPVLATTIFSFLMSGLAYFQCFNYSAKKRMNEV